MTVGESIRNYRTARGMSQGDLADALDVSRQSVSKWENDQAVPELDKLVSMAALFGVTLDTLVKGGGAGRLGRRSWGRGDSPGDGIDGRGGRGGAGGGAF